MLYRPRVKGAQQASNETSSCALLMSVETILYAVLLELKDPYAKATRLQRAVQHGTSLQSLESRVLTYSFL